MNSSSISKKPVVKTNKTEEEDLTQSQEERRKLRKEYRELKDVLVHNSYSLASVPSVEFSNCHNTINSLFHKVGNIREIAIDAEGSMLIL